MRHRLACSRWSRIKAYGLLCFRVGWREGQYYVSNRKSIRGNMLLDSHSALRCDIPTAAAVRLLGATRLTWMSLMGP